jgi:Uma2 family endonuclease
MSVELEAPPVAPYDESEEAEDKNMALDIHGNVCFNIVGSLYIYSKTHKLGYFFDSSTTYIFPDSPPKRIPDASFVSYQKLPALRGKEINVAPDLAVEVVSKHDTGIEINDKINHYLAVGVRLIWIVYPNSKQVFVHRQDGSISKFTMANNDGLDGETVLPGFKLPLADIFEGIEETPALDSVE